MATSQWINIRKYDDFLTDTQVSVKIIIFLLIISIILVKGERFIRFEGKPKSETKKLVSRALLGILG